MSMKDWQRRQKQEENQQRRKEKRVKKQLESEFPILNQTATQPQEMASMDRPLLLLIIALSAVGLLTLFSATANQALDAFGNSLYFVARQFVFFAIGFALMWVISRTPYLVWLRLAKPISFVVIGLLAYTILNGVEAYGAERWIRIFGIQFQPSELSKLSIILLLAQALRVPFGQNSFGWVVNSALISVTLALIFKQPSLSMTLVMSFVTLMMAFIAGVRPLGIAIFCSLGGVYMVHKVMTTEYQMRRIVGWLNPWGDPQDTGYNLIQSLYAIGSGGLLGNGIGGSYQKHAYLPFHHTDFIFAIFAEEWGFLGCISLIGLYLAIFWRGLVIIQNTRSPFAQYLAIGIVLCLALQVFVNLGVVTGLLPVTGLTLPLVSNGGTSVVVTLLLLGILLNISRYQAPQTEDSGQAETSSFSKGNTPMPLSSL